MVFGIIDSGAGGLSVLRSLSFSQASLLYFSDSAYFPYGEKSVHVLSERVRIISCWVRSKGVNCLILGCHTASYALTGVSIPGLCDMVLPTVRSILNRDLRYGVVVLCTSLSVQYEHILKSELDARNFGLPVFFVPCPGLADLIEEAKWSEALSLLLHFLSLVQFSFDGIVYGCTHYALLDQYLPQSIKERVINPADCVMDVVRDYLCQNSEPAGIRCSPKVSFYCTAKNSFLSQHIGQTNSITYVSQEDLDRCAYDV